MVNRTKPKKTAEFIINASRPIVRDGVKYATYLAENPQHWYISGSLRGDGLAAEFLHSIKCDNNGDK
jgi:hypothetical protein